MKRKLPNSLYLGHASYVCSTLAFKPVMLLASQIVIFETAVWVFDIFDNNSEIKNAFRKHLKESCW